MKKKVIKSTLDTKFSDFREKLRKYCRKILTTEPARRKAARVIGYKYSYIRAVLDQREQGGFELWFSLTYYCASIETNDFNDKVEAFFDQDQPFQSFQELSASEIIFKNLSEIPIVTEDTKYRLVTNLQYMLSDLNKEVQRKIRR